MESAQVSLVVDDDPTFRAYLRQLLMSEGIDVVEADGGDEALERVRDNRIDLVLLDWRMPRQSGIRTLRAMREDPTLKQVPIIMVTALDDARDRALALEAGADAFVVKDSERSELRSTVQRLLGDVSP